MTKGGHKTLTVDIPVDLYNMYAKFCVDQGITKKEGIMQYLQHLKSQNQRKPPHADSRFGSAEQDA